MTVVKNCILRREEARRKLVLKGLMGMKVFVSIVFVREYWLSDNEEVEEQPHGSYIDQFRCSDHEQLGSVLDSPESKLARSPLALLRATGIEVASLDRAAYVWLSPTTSGPFWCMQSLDALINLERVRIVPQSGAYDGNLQDV
jgi:hypothetical protein